MIAMVPSTRSTSASAGPNQVIDIIDKYHIIYNILLIELHIMTKLLLQLAFLLLVFGTVHADENRNHRNANMLWSDNEELHRVNTPQVDPDLVNWNKYMFWSDDEEFQPF